LAQESPNVLLLVMNDRGYGVIRNIQDNQYGGRRCFVDMVTPDFATLAGSFGIPYRVIRSLADADSILAEALKTSGPCLVEVDMDAIGPVAEPFGGPPVRAS
jgi:acetolactate synthase-1/2/3 large subunit